MDRFINYTWLDCESRRLSEFRLTQRETALKNDKRRFNRLHNEEKLVCTYCVSQKGKQRQNGDLQQQRSTFGIQMLDGHDKSRSTMTQAQVRRPAVNQEHTRLNKSVGYKKGPVRP